MRRTYNWNIPEPAVLAEDRASRLKYAPELSHVSKLGLVAMLHVGLNFSVAQRRKPTFFGWSRRRTFFTRCQLRFLYFWRGVGYASYFWRDACHAFYFWRDACYAFYFWRGAGYDSYILVIEQYFLGCKVITIYEVIACYEVNTFSYCQMYSFVRGLNLKICCRGSEPKTGSGLHIRSKTMGSGKIFSDFNFDGSIWQSDLNESSRRYCRLVTLISLKFLILQIIGIFLKILSNKCLF